MAKQFAVIETGGKQYLVEEGSTLKIEKIKGDHVVGGKLLFDKVILQDSGSGTTLGAPYVAGAKGEGEIKKIARAPKVVVVKYKAKSRYYKKRGHRQPFFEVIITKLS